MTELRATGPRITIVGSGWAFTSGISYYTCQLSNALSEAATVSLVLMQRLLPRRLYPGSARVGLPLAQAVYDRRVEHVADINWYGGAGLLRGMASLVRQRSDMVVFQWWTAAVSHSYLCLALAATLRRSKIVLEMHEVQDTGEAAHRLARLYRHLMLRPLFRLTEAVVVHSEYDRRRIVEFTSFKDLTRVVVVPHGPFDYLAAVGPTAQELSVSKMIPVGSDSSSDCARLLFFGTIRPYKGLEHLVDAFSDLTTEEVRRLSLTIVGETWEGWTRPAELIARSPHRARIAFINRYVSDAELHCLLNDVDVMVLPYLRSSASGPLHLAMSFGLPVIVSDVGGLREAAGDYRGAIFVQPGDKDELQAALRTVRRLGKARHVDPHTWDRNVEALVSLINSPLRHDEAVACWDPHWSIRHAFARVTKRYCRLSPSR